MFIAVNQTALVVFQQRLPTAATHFNDSRPTPTLCGGSLHDSAYLSCPIGEMQKSVVLTELLVFAVRASSSAVHGHEHHRSDLEVVRQYRSTLNDIPVPEGSWQEHYDKRNAKWNMMLGASFVFFVGTLYVVCELSWIVW